MLGTVPDSLINVTCARFYNYFGLRRSPFILRMGSQGSAMLGAYGDDGGCESQGRALDSWKGVNLVLWHSEKRRPPQGDLLGDPAEELGCELGFERALGFWEVLRKHFMDGKKEFVWLEWMVIWEVLRLRNETGESLRNVNFIQWARIQDIWERWWYHRSDAFGSLSCLPEKKRCEEGGVFRGWGRLRRHCSCPACRSDWLVLERCQWGRKHIWHFLVALGMVFVLTEGGRGVRWETKDMQSQLRSEAGSAFKLWRLGKGLSFRRWGVSIPKSGEGNW